MKELYEIVATCANYTGAGNPRTFDFLPENFKGIKITQKFNFVNPMGYTPSFSVETMKAIEEDKAWLDSIFDTYGLQSKVTFEISKLNATATDYTVKNSFLVDFESYSKHDLYSEFALRSISCLDEYNKTKNTARNFTGATALELPTTQNLINYVSVKFVDAVLNGDNTASLNLEENNDSSVFNNDTATYGSSDILYQFDRPDTVVVNMSKEASGRLLVNFDWVGSETYLRVKIFKNDFSTSLATLAAQKVNYGSSIYVDIDAAKLRMSNITVDPNDYLFVGVVADDPNFEITGIFGNFEIDLWVATEVEANRYGRKINYLTSESILSTIFDGKNTTETALQGYGITSAQAILKRNSYISLTPKDFLTDFCLATGSLVNFDNVGGVQIAKISTYFASLLQKPNAETVENFKDLTISPDTSLNFASVSFGMEQKTYDYFTYFNDFNKFLTFLQADREASETLNLALTKFRVDFSGILDYINKAKAASTDTATDLFLFNPNFTPRTTLEGSVYDVFTPRDMMENWRKFLEVCFYNYSLYKLSLSSNSGDSYNLQINGVNQFDDIILSSNDPRILPVKVSFSCLVTDVDFTSKILKVTHNGVDLYIFVTEAQTTDSLEEQKITGNLIYFAS